MTRHIRTGVNSLVGMTLAATLVLGMASGVQSVAGEEGAADDGQAIFLAQKCNMCHGVPAASIEAKAKVEKLKGPDLPTATPREAEWVAQFLRKQVQLDGKDHKKEYKGTDEELQTMLDWLAQQKPAS